VFECCLFLITREEMEAEKLRYEQRLRDLAKEKNGLEGKKKN
jgi:hypothetical protein